MRRSSIKGAEDSSEKSKSKEKERRRSKKPRKKREGGRRCTWAVVYSTEQRSRKQKKGKYLRGGSKGGA